MIDHDSGNESIEESSIDPSCFVAPHSAKAHSGVSKYTDFIHCLPIHLAKMILGLLDQPLLHICSKVSRRWAAVVDEVQEEYFVNQELKEEVMLMQGAASNGCNPNYAKDVDVLVPNIADDSYKAIQTGQVKDPQYKSEHTFETAYTGYSTRKIIMEERNVYCGPYNVMVLHTGNDRGYVIHTDDNFSEINAEEKFNLTFSIKSHPSIPKKKSRLIALGCSDKKVRFINSDNAKFEGPTIWGHAGSIRCVAINSKKGYVLSGSYDTSIRQWSIRTRKCLRILHGHRDSITCLEIYKNNLVSGSKDRSCKVWDLLSGTCMHTFKHKHGVSAVALNDDLCISGDEGSIVKKEDSAQKEIKGGDVKVWNMKNGDLIKVIDGHTASITAIKLDRWHIVTGSKDRYALVWSSQGNHRMCLSALRHPKEVLCLSFSYLRVITGSADGKLRIWNILTGQCLRIMRGNSKSDPILALIAIDNRITFNTSNMLLTLNFEKLEYDYTLENDRMPSLVKYSKYSDAVVREHPYPYIRAQRMRAAGATNTKIVQRQHSLNQFRSKRRQLCQSSKTLSEQNMQSARRVQSCSALELNTDRASKINKDFDTPQYQRRTAPVTPSTPGVTNKSLYGTLPAATSSKNTTTSIGKSVSLSALGGRHQVNIDEGDSIYTDEEGKEYKRRVSWAFENVLLRTNTVPIGLEDTKSLLRSQMRNKDKPVPPDFIYLSVNNIQSNMKPQQASKHLEEKHRDKELNEMKKSGRPSSSPSRIDPKTKVAKEWLGIDGILIEHGIKPTEIKSEHGLNLGSKLILSQEPQSPTSGNVRPYTNPLSFEPLKPTTDTYRTDFNVHCISTSPTPHSIHPQNVQSTIPPANVLRPGTAILEHSKALDGKENLQKRPKSAAFTTHSSLVGSPYRHKKEPLTSECNQPTQNLIPMKMYSKAVLDRIEQLRTRTRQKAAMMGASAKDKDGTEANLGKVSQFNMPFRTHVKFELKTQKQVSQDLRNIEHVHANQKKMLKIEQNKQQRQTWLASVMRKK